MIDPDSQCKLKEEIASRIESDRAVLDQLRDEIRPLKSSTRHIQPRTTTSISLVATDGGNNRLEFDPFLVQLIRVVDSSNNEYCLEAITPTSSTLSLSRSQFAQDGKPITALGRMMECLGANSISDLSPMIKADDGQSPRSPSWVQVYRELVEWAVLLSIVRDKQYGSDTLIVFDGLLRSKVFTGNLFTRYLEVLQQSIAEHLASSKRKIWLAGVAKHSKVLARYRLAMALEGVMTVDYPAYVEIPREIEENAYVWSEYARGDDSSFTGTEINKYVGGKMFFVKFGSGRRDPIWPIDIFSPQVPEAQNVIGCMLADAINGFPVPFYPQSLQKAHANAALVDFDFDILQDQVFDAIKRSLGSESPVLDSFRLQSADPAQSRYT